MPLLLGVFRIEVYKDAMKKAWRDRVERTLENGDTVMTGSAIVHGFAEGLEVVPRRPGVDPNPMDIIAGLAKIDADANEARMVFRAFNALGLEAFHIVGRGVLSTGEVTYFTNSPRRQAGGLFMMEGEFTTSGKVDRVTTLSRRGLFPDETRIAAQAVIRAAEWGPSDITFHDLDTLGSRAHVLGKDFLSRV